MCSTSPAVVLFRGQAQGHWGGLGSGMGEGGNARGPVRGHRCHLEGKLETGNLSLEPSGVWGDIHIFWDFCSALLSFLRLFFFLQPIAGIFA